jgi:hypothetical protein
MLVTLGGCEPQAKGHVAATHKVAAYPTFGDGFGYSFGSCAADGNEAIPYSPAAFQFRS